MNFIGCKFEKCDFGSGRIRLYLTVFNRTFIYSTAFQKKKATGGVAFGALLSLK